MQRLFFLLATLLTVPLAAQKLNVQVRLLGNGNVLPMGSVKLGELWQATDANGTAAFKVQEGRYRLAAGYVGFHDTVFDLRVTTDTTISIHLRERDVLLTEVEVSDTRLSGAGAVLQNQVMRSSITPAEVAARPMIGGEPDILKPLQLLPGVQSGLPGNAELYVRGGDQYQNSVMLDGFPIYNLSHGLGYASAIPVAAVERLDLYKQGFPVQYGNATASFTDVSLERADTRNWSGEIGGGIGSFRGKVNVPLVEGVSGLQLGGRFSTIGIAMELLQLFDVSFEGLFGFHDMAGKYHHRLSERDVVEVVGYYSADNIRSGQNNIGNDIKINTGNLLGGATFLHSTKSNALITQKVHFSNYSFTEDKTEVSPDYYGGTIRGRQFLYDYHVNNIGYEGSWEKQVGASSRLLAGVEFNAHLFHMPKLKVEDGRAPVDYPETEAAMRPVYNPVVFAAYEWQLAKALRLNTGLRLSGFSYENEEMELKPLPRVSLTFNPLEQWAFFAAYDRTAQAYHRFRNTFFGSALDFPLPATDRLPVQESGQTALGAVFSAKRFSINAQLFYRNIFNTVDRDYSKPTLVYDTEGDQTPDPDPLAALLSVNGRAYGVETGFDYRWNIFQVQGSYTWSRSFRQSPLINGGEEYPFEYNREHQVNVAGKVRFKQNSINKITEIGVSYTYGTGNYTQFPVQQRAMPGLEGADVIGFENYYIRSRNNAQLPALQHLDVVVNFIAKKKRGVRVFSISAFNLLFSPLVTNYVYQGDQLRGEGPLMFVPAITYTYKFQ